MISERISNYTYVSHRDEVPWVRPKDFREIELPRPTVMINGGFDLLHSGHMKIIWKARHHAGIDGCVICCLDSDTRMGRKGPERPIQTFIERATTLSFMPIDYIVEIETDSDMYDVIRASKPDVRVQGPEYRDVPSKYAWVPKLYVPCLGRTGTRIGMGTTKIIERILARCGNKSTNG